MDIYAALCRLDLQPGGGDLIKKQYRQGCNKPSTSTIYIAYRTLIFICQNGKIPTFFSNGLWKQGEGRKKKDLIYCFYPLETLTNPPAESVPPPLP